MTQIASLLAVATVFIGLWTLFYSQGGGLIHEIKLPMQELELKMGVGCNHGILQYMHKSMSSIAIYFLAVIR